MIARLGRSLPFVAFGSILTTGFAADVPTKTQPTVVSPPASAVVSPWDIAFGAAIMSDYNFRGITQSNRKPSGAYFEPRYNFNDSWQGYLGLSGESISFPNRAAAEIDFYGRRFADLLRRVENCYHSFQHQRSSGKSRLEG